MIKELIKIANELDERRLFGEADGLDLIIRRAMARPADPVLETFREYVRDADKRLHEKHHKDRGAVESSHIVDYYKEHPISFTDQQGTWFVDLEEFYNNYRTKKGLPPVGRRRFLSSVNKARAWSPSFGMAQDLARNKHEKIRNLLKKIEKERGSADWMARIAEETGYSRASIQGYSMAHTIDSPFGQFLGLLTNRYPGAKRKDLYKIVLSILEEDNFLNFLNSIREEEFKMFPNINKITSKEDLEIKTKFKEDGSIAHYSNFNREVMYTLAILNQAQAARSRYQASALERIIEGIVLDDLQGSIDARSSGLWSQSCGRLYVPGMPNETFKTLFENPFITDEFLSIKLSQYLEECFKITRAPATIQQWMNERLGLFKKRNRETLKIPLNCEVLLPILNRLVCVETTYVRATGAADVKMHWLNVYRIMQSFLKENLISLPSCLKANEANKAKSCSPTLQNKYESLRQLFDHDLEWLYNVIKKEIDEASSNQGFGDQVVNQIKSYFEEVRHKSDEDILST